MHYNHEEKLEASPLQREISYAKIGQRAIDAFSKDLSELFPAANPSKSVGLSEKSRSNSHLAKNSQIYGIRDRTAPETHVGNEDPTYNVALAGKYQNSQIRESNRFEDVLEMGRPTKQTFERELPKISQLPRKWTFDSKLEGSPVPQNKPIATNVCLPKQPEVEQFSAVSSSLKEQSKPVVPKLNISAVTEENLQKVLPIKLLRKASSEVTEAGGCPSTTSNRLTDKADPGIVRVSESQTQHPIITEAAQESKALLERITKSNNPSKAVDSVDSQQSESLWNKYPAPRSRDSGAGLHQQFNTFRPNKYETGDSEGSGQVCAAANKTQVDWKPPQVPTQRSLSVHPPTTSSTQMLPQYVSFARDAESLGSANYKTADFNLSDKLETSQPERGSAESHKDRIMLSPGRLDSFMMNPDENVFRTDQIFEETTTKLQELKNLCLGDLLQEEQESARESQRGFYNDLNRVININLTPRSSGSRDDEPSFAGVDSCEPSDREQPSGNGGALEALSTLQKKLEGLSSMAHLTPLVSDQNNYVEKPDEAQTTITSRECASDLPNQGQITSNRDDKTSVTGDLASRREDFGEGDLDLQNIRKQLEDILQDSIALEYSENNTAYQEEEKRSHNPNLTSENFDFSRNLTPRTGIQAEFLTEDKSQLSLRKHAFMDSTKRTENQTPLSSERVRAVDEPMSVTAKRTGVKPAKPDTVGENKRGPDSGRKHSARADSENQQPSGPTKPKYSDIIDRFMREIIHSEEMDKLNSPRYL